MYSLGVYLVSTDQSDLDAVYHCLFNSKWRSATTAVPSYPLRKKTAYY